jgi:hypothetical protein
MAKNKTNPDNRFRFATGSRRSWSGGTMPYRYLGRRAHRTLGLVGRVGQLSDAINLIYWNWRTGQYAATGKLARTRIQRPPAE